MQSKQPLIQSYSIGDVSEDLGSGLIATDFHVFSSDEVALRDNFMGRPVRSDHFTVALVVKGEAGIKHNLIDYVLPKNSLFIITPQVTHQFQKPQPGYHIIGMGFSRDFLGQAHISEKHINAFDFFSSQSKPQYLLSDNEAKIMEDLLLLLKEKGLAGERHPFKNEIIYHAFNLFVYELAAILKSTGRMKT